MTTGSEAPELDVVQWFNTDEPLSLARLRGRVVVLHAFQMLCPGCVHYGIPQAQRIAALFSSDHVAVIGLHTVFEHHAAMTPVSLQAFLHEYRVTFPVAVDRPGTEGPIPRTMAAYGMKGTPTLVLIDRLGRLRKQAFGKEEDLQAGADIATLLSERPDA
ncbi:MAG: redoxin family protein [Bauldia sp.]|nr:redoxin family protein [Bauldia sp.]